MVEVRERNEPDATAEQAAECHLRLADIGALGTVCTSLQAGFFCGLFVFCFK